MLFSVVSEDTLPVRLFPSVLLPLKLFRLFLPILRKLVLRLGALVPIGEYVLWKLFFLHESAKLNASSFSLCSF
jgi:hypothetical protein